MEIVIDKNRLGRAMSACVENGQRLQQDAEFLGTDSAATIVALCILAQEEYAKAFLLHLVCEGTVPWTAKVRESLRNHKHKQLLGLIMEWLSPSDDEFSARIKTKPGYTILPAHVTDAMKLYVEDVQPQGHISCPPAASDPMAKSVANGDRDKMKQDAIYVRLSQDGNVISVPTQFTSDAVNAELDRTKRLSDLVRPLREGDSSPGFDYHVTVEMLNFLLLEKRNRPFLLLRDSAFGGTTASKAGIAYPRCITVNIENISYEQATHCSGYGTVFIDNKAVRPSFRFEEFVVDPCAMIGYALGVSEETYVSATVRSRMVDVHMEIEYHGSTALPTYLLKAWITFDIGTGSFRERLTHVQESGDQ